ncbi:MAG: DUF1566 domain-containing protein [Natronospirillum sp.]|uniref:Lcl C-terminal domain-containing protein n=1 Tax=Natronospirillum sp. TaxID=2812955 RepID=UPI0025CC6FBA|nr:DUF1566 domain-containing protein [Natronospirillum sp.]MCH8551256.1 DUF1566 domain-containing protein [Natronospirillum sp.]
MNKLIMTLALVSGAMLLSACNSSSSSNSGSGSNTTGDNGNTGGNNTGTDVAVDTSNLAVRTQPMRGSVLVDFEAINGADTYLVYTSTSDISSSSPSAGASAVFTCPESPCLVSGLENGRLLNLRLEAASGSSQVDISSQLAVVAGAINDSGESSCITVGNDAFSEAIAGCTQIPTGSDIWPTAVFNGAVELPAGRVAQQDGNSGRDANGQLIKLGSGEASFDYTKLDSNGNPVSASSTAFECLRDNVTGLVWQTNRPSGQDWQGLKRDYGAAESHSEEYSRCGLTSGWRLPTKAEAESLLHYSRTGVSADTTFFTDLEDDWYWTSSAYPAALSGPDADLGVQNDSVGSNFHHWVINFTTGQRSTFDFNGAGPESQSLTMYVNSTANQ